MSYITLRNEFIGYSREDDGRFDVPQETAFANGAAMMIRTADTQKFGYMSEYYFYIMKNWIGVLSCIKPDLVSGMNLRLSSDIKKVPVSVCKVRYKYIFIPAIV